MKNRQSVRLAIALAAGATLVLLFVVGVGAAMEESVPKARTPPAIQLLFGPTVWTTSTISVDTTWTITGSPYLVRAYVTVQSNATLTVEPGVVVKFDADKGLDIGDYFFGAGTLHAVGTVTQPIVFTSIKDDSVHGDDNGDSDATTPAAGDWDGIKFYGPDSSGSHLRHVQVRYGGYNQERGGLSIDSASPTVEDSTISHNWQVGIYCTGDAAPLLSNLVITDTAGGYGYGLSIAWSASPILRDSAVLNSDGDGIHIWQASQPITLSGNSITDNGDSGICIEDSTSILITDNVIMRNSVVGVYVDVDSADPAIHYNYFVDNTAAVTNTGTNCIDARWNYWGHPDGPDDDSATTDACGLGANDNDAGQDVSDNVNYTDWLKHGPLHHFTFDPIPAQTAGVPFTITISARDEFENLVTAYTGTATLTDTTGTLFPTSVTFVSGWATTTVAIQTPAPEVRLAARDGDIAGTSNAFTVVTLGWEQANTDGFGDAGNTRTKAMAVFQNRLYVGTENTTTGGQLWRSADGQSWTQAAVSGTVGIGAGDQSVTSLAVFGNQLYLATQEGRVYRSSTGVSGTWSLVNGAAGFGNSYNKSPLLAAFEGQLYAAVTNSQNGVQVWRSSTGDSWTRVVQGGFGEVSNRNATAIAVFGDHLYVAVRDTTTFEGKLWRSDTGNSGEWSKVQSFANAEVKALASYAGYLYAGTTDGSVSPNGGDLWRSTDGQTWEQVTSDGFGDSNNSVIRSLATFRGHLYAGTVKAYPNMGAEIWQGNTWLQANLDGFRNLSNTIVSALSPFHGRLYAATYQSGLGTQVWRSVPSLATHADASFIGEGIGDESSYSALARVGDVNGDGYDDFLIGAYRNDEGATRAGQAYLFLGRSGGDWGMNFDLSQADASFRGETASDGAGYSVAGAGDVNGDDLADFLIGAPWAGTTTPSQGKAYLIFGRRAADWGMDFNLFNADASFLGEATDDRAGYSVAGAGDVDNDGYDDVLIAAAGNDAGGDDAGQTYLIFGKASGWAKDTPLSTAGASFLGEDNDGAEDTMVAGAGDVNGDGYGDFLISANRNDEGSQDAGQTYLILGQQATNFTQDMSLTVAADASFMSNSINSYSGQSIAGAGDVNGDSYGDLLIGAPGYGSGRAYLVLGKTSGWAKDTLLSTADAAFVGGDNERAGSSVSGVGDANGDGFADFLIGAEYHSGRAGAGYLVFGRAAADWGTSFDLAQADGQYIGEWNQDRAGQMASGAGDVNGDGLGDLLVGAYLNDEGGDEAGQTYLVLGRGLGLAKRADKAMPGPGDSLTYTVHLENSGDVAVQVVLTDTLPYNVDYLAGSASGWAGEMAGGVLTQAVYLTPEESRSFTYTAAVVDDAFNGARIENAVALNDGVNPPRTITATTVVSSPTRLPDLSVDSLFVRPPVVHDGIMAGVGARFGNATRHRLSDVRVAFFDGPPNAGGTLIGGTVYTIPVFHRRVVTWTGRVWNTTGEEGLHRIYAVIDAGDRISETDETNNWLSRVIRIRPAVSDTVAPTGVITVASGAQLTTSPAVTLALDAQDTGGSGLQQMRIAEYAYSSALRGWVRAGDSGWISYTTSYNWNLSTGAGVKYLLAWFRDGDGNVSWPATRDFINYLPASASIGQGQWDLYRLWLVQNRMTTLTLTATSDDPDLFVWFPDNDRWPDRSGIESGSDQVAFRARRTGMYQIGVYGHAAATYGLGIGIGWYPGSLAMGAAEIGPMGSDKLLPGEPPVTDDDFPLGEETVTEVSYEVYLPTVLKSYP